MWWSSGKKRTSATSGGGEGMTHFAPPEDEGLGLFSRMRRAMQSSDSTAVPAPMPHPAAPPPQVVVESAPRAVPPARSDVVPSPSPPSGSSPASPPRGEAELRRYWMPDSSSAHCSNCGDAFHLLRRRHHCRICGRVYCWRCSSHWIETQNGRARACDQCAAAHLQPAGQSAPGGSAPASGGADERAGDLKADELKGSAGSPAAESALTASPPLSARSADGLSSVPTSTAASDLKSGGVDLPKPDLAGDDPVSLTSSTGIPRRKEATEAFISTSLATVPLASAANGRTDTQDQIVGLGLDWISSVRDKDPPRATTAQASMAPSPSAAPPPPLASSQSSSLPSSSSSSSVLPSNPSSPPSSPGSSPGSSPLVRRGRSSSAAVEGSEDRTPAGLGRTSAEEGPNVPHKKTHPSGSSKEKGHPRGEGSARQKPNRRPRSMSSEVSGEESAAPLAPEDLAAEFRPIDDPTASTRRRSKVHVTPSRARLRNLLRAATLDADEMEAELLDASPAGALIRQSVRQISRSSNSSSAWTRGGETSRPVSGGLPVSPSTRREGTPFSGEEQRRKDEEMEERLALEALNSDYSSAPLLLPSVEDSSRPPLPTTAVQTPPSSTEQSATTASFATTTPSLVTIPSWMDGEGVASATEDELDEDGSGMLGPACPVAARSVRQREMEQVRRSILERVVVAQLQRAGLSVERWRSVVQDFALQAAGTVFPHLGQGDAMTVVPYVKVQRVPTGSPAESAYVEGAVLVKNTAHKRMRASIAEPRILLLLQSLEYERNPHRISSFDTMLMQEAEYLRIAVSKIQALRPDLVVVERSASRIAQNLLLDAGISLVYNVGRLSRMRRLARLTLGDLVSDIDALDLRRPPRLGRCRSFRIVLSRQKDPGCRPLLVPLAYFEGCKPSLGATVLLHGAPAPELSLVKHVLRFSMYLAFNLLLRAEMLLDFGAAESLGAQPFESSSSLMADELGLHLILSSSELLSHSSSPFIPSQPQHLFNSSSRVRSGSSVPLWNDSTSTNQTPSSSPPTATSTTITGIPSTFHPSSTSTTSTPSLSSSVTTIEPTSLNTSGATHPHGGVGGGGGSSGGGYVLCFPASIRRPYLLQSVHYRSAQPQLTTFNYARLFAFDPTSAAAVAAEEAAEHGRLYRRGVGPYAAQTFVYMYSVICETTQVHCLPYEPHVVDFYTDNDMTLGSYLLNMCFQNNLVCQVDGCGRPYAEHQRTFLHGCGRLNVSVGAAEGHAAALKVAPAAPRENEIQYTSVCSVCHARAPYRRLSPKALHASFGMFLRCTFYGQSASIAGCSHSLMRDHVRYFFYRGAVAEFSYAPLVVRTVVMPSLMVRVHKDACLILVKAQLRSLQAATENAFDLLRANLRQLVEVTAGLDAVPADAERLLAEVGREYDLACSKMQALLLSEYDIFDVNRSQRMVFASLKTWLSTVNDLWARAQHQANRRVAQVVDLEESTSTDLLPSLSAPALRRLQEELTTSSMMLLPQLDGTAAITSSTDLPALAPADFSSSDLDLANPPVLAAEDGSTLPSQPVQSDSALSERDSLSSPDLAVASKPLAIDSSSDDPPVEIQVAAVDSSSPSHRLLAELSPSQNPHEEDVKDGPKGGRIEDVHVEETVVQDHNKEEEVAKDKVLEEEKEKGTVVDEESKFDEEKEKEKVVEEHEKVEGIEEAELKLKEKDSEGETTKANGTSKSASPVAGGGVDGKEDSIAPVTTATASATASAAAPLSAVGGGLLVPPPSDVSSSSSSSSSKQHTPVPGAASVSATPSAAARAAKSPAAQEAHTPAVRSSSTMGPLGRAAAFSSALEVELKDRRELRDRILVFSNVGASKRRQEALLSTLGSGLILSNAADEHMVIVHPGCISTIIAYCLSSSEYHFKFDAIFPLPNGTPSAASPPSSDPSDASSPISVGNPIAVSAGGNLTAPAASVASSLNSTVASTTTTTTTTGAPVAHPLSSEVSGLAIPGAVPPLSSPSPASSSPSAAANPSVPNILSGGGPGAANASSTTTAPSASATAAGNPASSSTSGRAGAERPSAQQMLTSPERIHLRTTFQHEENGRVHRFECVVYYASQFSALRSLVVEGGDASFVASLCLSQSWDARGGKSGSSFSKTLDDRYVLKDISRIELVSFLDVAPLYFEYLLRSRESHVSTALCKIVGLFGVQWTQPNGKVTHQEIIVMENLFYSRNVSRMYDLKGSVRNRYMETGEEEDHSGEVLLDMNLLEELYDHPLVISDQAKAQLSLAMWNDSLYLSSIGVMDYSLLVGVDDDTGEVVVGIIDYLRKYTWDKQVETYIKSMGLLGGGRGKAPTVISPKQYKIRFRDAMWLYFVMAPDVRSRVIRLADLQPYE